MSGRCDFAASFSEKRKPYYIMQKDYAADSDSEAAYYNFPCINYPQLPPDIELRGDSYGDGFHNKYIVNY